MTLSASWLFFPVAQSKWQSEHPKRCRETTAAHMSQRGKGVPPGKAPGKGNPKGKGRPPGPGAPPPPRPGPGSKCTRDPRAGPKLRPLFWQTVTQVPSESVWNKICPPVPFDAELLEHRFALAETRAPLASLTARKGGAGLASSDEVRKKVRVLDDRTSQLLAIAFNKLPPAEQLAQIVESLDAFPDGLPPEALIALNAASVDQKEAVEQLRHMDIPESEILQLDVPERYLWVLANRPLCAAKVACGALMFGLAPELPDLGLACKRIFAACKALRTSQLISQFISTCLAVGNAMNRGTPRDGARAVVLPDGLLKLDELRGNSDMEGVSGPSLLDFVAEAILLEAVCQCNYGQQQAQQLSAELCAQASDLRESVRAAQGVCMLEAEKSCQRIWLAASRAHGGLAQYLQDPSAAHIAVRVSEICEEVERTSQRVAAAKEDLKFTMGWLSAKPGTSPAEWLGNWVHFLDQLSSALQRVQLPASIPQRHKADESRQLRDVTNEAHQMSEHVDSDMCCKSASMQSVQLDDDERIEVLLARMRSQEGDASR